MDSPPTISITREQFIVFHKCDRDLFTRLVMVLRRDINQSYQVMSFLLHLEKIAVVKNLIANLASAPDVYVNMVADQVVTCMICLSYQDFPAFVTYLRINNLSPAIPHITGLTGGYLTLIVIHNHRGNIMFEMKQHLTRVCIPAFEDIWMYHMEFEERRKAIAKMNQRRTSRVFHKGESSTSQFLSGEQVHAHDRTIFLTFSRGYPVSKEEVHAYFTRTFGEIIVAIHMGGAGANEQTLYATMELNSPAMIPQILIAGLDRTKFIINGKHVWARRFIPSHKPSSNNLLSRSF
ncbi:unnamed protein product [Eruca vesicaria subsp. sativa]|uniref:Uncharacterized protein n=1 Tax=Eruca vesicaria subsp. sativa TaxID=29727 RepID=A0ABC8JJ23_ERUVS|nr:unnamed protein product [Eruca vesicaria subsp. sativa]